MEEDEEGAVDFSGRDDAETVRGAKMKSETKKRGRKGKSEQVIKCIAKLGARIKCLLGREDARTNGIVKRSGLRNAVEEHDSSSRSVTQPDDSNATNKEIQEQASSAWDDWTGLVPFIYRAIKERRARRYSRCRSTGSAHARFGARVEVEDGAWEQSQWEADGKVPAASEMTTHRRGGGGLARVAGRAFARPQWTTGLFVHQGRVRRHTHAQD